MGVLQDFATVNSFAMNILIHVSYTHVFLFVYL